MLLRPLQVMTDGVDHQVARENQTVAPRLIAFCAPRFWAANVRFIKLVADVIQLRPPFPIGGHSHNHLVDFQSGRKVRFRPASPALRDGTRGYERRIRCSRQVRLPAARRCCIRPFFSCRGGRVMEQLSGQQDPLRTRP
jgi:hypothetical protein